MNDAPQKEGANAENRFDQQSEQKQVGLIAEFGAFLRYNRKWWLAPIVVALVLLAGLVWLGGTAAAPFIYTLF